MNRVLVSQDGDGVGVVVQPPEMPLVTAIDILENGLALLRAARQAQSHALEN